MSDLQKSGFMAFDDPAARRAILRRQSVRREHDSVFPRIWRVFQFLGSCVFKFLFLVFILALVSGGLIYIYNNLMRSPYIKLESVILAGVEEPMRTEILKLANIEPETSLFAINVDEVKERVGKHPWVGSVSVEKQFPHALVIHVEREEPWAIVGGKTLKYMNRKGRIFKEVEEGDPADFPVVTGIPDGAPETDRRVEMAVQVLTALESEEPQWSREQLSEIHVRGDGSVYLYYVSLPFGVKMRAAEVVKRMEDLKRVVDHLNRSGGIRTARAINLEYAEGAVVSFRKG